MFTKKHSPEIVIDVCMNVIFKKGGHISLSSETFELWLILSRCVWISRQCIEFTDGRTGGLQTRGD